MNNKCPQCKGFGLVVRAFPSEIYKCGFVTIAVTCPACLGFGRVMPISEPDRKMAAAGEAQ